MAASTFTPQCVLPFNPEQAYEHFQASTDKRETAFSDARQAHDLTEQAGTPFPIALSGFNLAQVAHACGDSALAWKLHAKSKGIADDMQSRILQCQCGLLAAELARDAGDIDRCLSELKGALGGMRANGYVMFAGWQNDVMARLCAIALRHDIEPVYTRELIRKRSLAPPAADVPGPEWPWPLRLRTLGEFSVEVDGEPVSFGGKAQRKPIEFLRALIALGSRDVDERALADALWPDAEGDAALQSLATTLHRTRKLLAIDGALVRAEGRLSLNPSCTWVDTVAFETALETAEVARREGSDPQVMRHWLETALAYYGGPFLSDGMEVSWAISLHERLESRFGRAVELLAGMHQKAGRSDEAVALYEYGIDRAPLLETLYQGVIRAHLGAGRVAAATSTYRRCESMFMQKLGILPAPDTKALLGD